MFFVFNFFFFFFNDTATTEIYTLSLHDALPIFAEGRTITQPALQRDTLGAVTPATDGFNVAVGESLGEVERRLILHTVQRCRTQEEAARILGISTKTLYNKLRIYDAGPRGRLRFVVPITPPADKD